MGKQRASLDFSDELENLNETNWDNSSAPEHERPEIPKEDIRHVAEESGFTSREGDLKKKDDKPETPRRVYRTGRSVQMNMKVRQTDKDYFYEICEKKDWVLGLGFQRAMEALRREIEPKKNQPEI